MDDRRAWRLLPATHPDVPVLLVSAVFGPAGYAVHLTDLVHVWAEQLDRRALCMRAFQENTPIDPSYDAEQMAVFLGKLGAAFDAAHPDYGQTRLALGAIDTTDNTTNNELVLRVTAALPGGLPPLRWPLHLRRQPPGALAAALVLPLVQAQAARRRERAALVAALRDKDAALAKLADKLEALGAGVDSAFPALAAGGSASGSGGGAGGGRRKWTRADVEQRVRGLAPFREATLEQLMAEAEADDEQEATDVRRLVESVFGAGAGGGPPLVHSSAAAQAALAPAVARLDGWWSGLIGGSDSGSSEGLSLSPVAPGGGTTGATAGVGDAAETTVAAAPTTVEAEPAGDDPFQTTPQRPVVVSRPRAEGDAAASPPTTPTKATAPPPTRQKAGLGKIGGGRRLGALGQKAKPAAAQPEAETETEMHMSPEAKPDMHIQPADDANDETASEAETEAPASGQAASTASTAVDPVAPVGGEPQTPSPARRPARGGLGRIGGKAAAAKKAEAEPDTAATQASAAAATGPAPDNTRAALLQQAVAKHAAPVRKKRKF